MDSQQFLAHLSSLENILHEFEELKEWYKGEEPLESVLDELVKSNKLKYRRVETESHIYNIYWLPSRDHGCGRLDVQKNCETPPSNRLIRGASRSFKRSRSSFVSPLLSKRTKTSDVVAQKLSFNSDPVATTSTNDDSSVIVSTETVGSDVSQSHKRTELSATDTSHLMKRKMELQCTLAEKQEKLRKLRMVKLYRSKNDLNHLEKLIKKWREVSQEAAEQLLQMTTHPDTSLRQLLDYLHIDYDTIHYSVEDDAFY